MDELRDRGCLVIPDVHQNYNFLKAISLKEDFSSFEKIVFLGDLLDAKESRYHSIEAIEKTLDFVIQTRSSNPGRVTVLLGNHDVLHFALSSDSVGSFEKNALIDYYGMPKSEVLAVCRRFGSFWNHVNIVVEAGEYLLSHAGVSARFWDDRKSVLENVAAINGQKTGIVDSENNLSDLFQAGKSRGGSLDKGGPIWLDWNQEFENEIGVSQIVGHTVGAEVRKNGDSYCLDAMQRFYGIVRGSEVIVRQV